MSRQCSKSLIKCGMHDDERGPARVSMIGNNESISTFIRTSRLPPSFHMVQRPTLQVRPYWHGSLPDAYGPWTVIDALPLD
jgi:hypothetical protein